MRGWEIGNEVINLNENKMKPTKQESTNETQSSKGGVVESADFPSLNNEGTPLLDEYGKKICNCVDPNRTYMPDGAVVCMNCWGEWYH